MSPSSVLFRLPRAHKNTHARTSSESASSSRSLPPPLYLFALLSPSLSPDSSHVCSTGARARGTAGAAFAPSDVCVRLCRSLINTGTGTAKLTSPTSLLTLSQGFQALKNKKKPKLYCTLVCDDKMTIHSNAAVHHILCFFLSPLTCC